MLKSGKFGEIWIRVFCSSILQQQQRTSQSVSQPVSRVSRGSIVTLSVFVSAWSAAQFGDKRAASHLTCIHIVRLLLVSTFFLTALCPSVPII